MPYNRNMTAEMIRESVITPEDIAPETEKPVAAPHRVVRRPAALATQEELDGLDELIAAAEKQNGPVSEEALKQFYSDLAAADAEIGRIR